MGGALLEGWLRAKLIHTVEICDPGGISETIQRSNKSFHVKRAENMTFQQADLVILAVKPQILDEVLAEVKERIPAGVPVLSIAAGKPLSALQSVLPANHPVIRTMPNTPAAVGAGITALYEENCTTEHKQMVSTLFGAVGQSLWLEEESLMDAVTAISGSGPAYLYYVVEALAQSAYNIDLSKENSKLLARQTIIGAARLLEAQPDIAPGQLRQNVTSSGGTTQAALDVLMAGEFQDILTKAVTAARDRAKELSN